MIAKKYCKKPVVIEAVQFDGDNGVEIADWIRENGMLCNFFWSTEQQFLDIVTLEGVMKVDVNDMVIKGIQGEMYPCKPDIFLDSYEAVNDEQD